MQPIGLDHLVLTVADPEATARFYEALGFDARSFEAADGSVRRALFFGSQKINLHVAGAEFAPHAKTPLPGSADLCFVMEGTAEDIAEGLAAAGIAVEEGPVERSGATGPITSLYLRDPDGNLIELSVYRT